MASADRTPSEEDPPDMSTRIQRVVAGVATLRPDDPVLRPAAGIAARTGAVLHLVHVAETGGADGDGARLRLEAHARAHAPDARVVAHVLSGRADEVLPRAADGVHADLIVLSHTRRGRLAGALLGTTAQGVLRHAQVPVLALHGTLPDGPPRVLLTTDLSAHSIPAHARGLAMAAALAAPHRPEAATLYVTVPTYVEEAAQRTDEAVAEARAELEAFLPAHAVDGLVPAPRVRGGDPAHQIVREAREWGADLLVVGTHGRRGAVRWLLGSVAENVLRTAPCGVLVVPPARTATPAGAPAREGAAPAAAA